MKKTVAILSSVFLLAACQDTTDATQESVVDEESGQTQVSTVESVESEAVSSEMREDVAYEYEINPDLYTVVPIDDADTEVVLLTFDDAPQPPNSYTLDIAQTVQDKGANAIFFVMGQFLEEPEAKEIIKTVYDMGFEIGNHSYSHPDLTTLTYEEQLAEITKTSDLVEEITGERPRFIRAPYGSYNSETEAIADGENMTIMNWTYGYDWVDGYMEEDAIADIMINAPELGSGGNLLMHDRQWTSAAISRIIDGLRDAGYEMVDPTLIASPEEAQREYE